MSQLYTEPKRHPLEMPPQHRKALSQIFYAYSKMPQGLQLDLVEPNIVRDTNVNSLNRQYNELKRDVDTLIQRVDRLERVLNVPPYAKIASSIETHLSKILVINEVHMRPIQSGFLLTIIHSAEFISQAIEQARPGLIELEDEFPNVYFDTWFLHFNEVHGDDLQQSALVFTRKNDE